METSRVFRAVVEVELIVTVEPGVPLQVGGRDGESAGLLQVLRDPENGRPHGSRFDAEAVVRDALHEVDCGHDILVTAAHSTVVSLAEMGEVR